MLLLEVHCGEVAFMNAVPFSLRENKWTSFLLFQMIELNMFNYIILLLLIWKQPLYLLEVEVRSLYTLPSPDPTL